MINQKYIDNIGYLCMVIILIGIISLPININISYFMLLLSTFIIVITFRKINKELDKK